MLDRLNPEGCEDESRICVCLKKGDVFDSSSAIRHRDRVGLEVDACYCCDSEDNHFFDELALKACLQKRVGSFTTVCMGTPLIDAGSGTGGVSPKGVRELVAAGVTLERSIPGSRLGFHPPASACLAEKVQCLQVGWEMSRPEPGSQECRPLR